MSKNGFFLLTRDDKLAHFTNRNIYGHAVKEKTEYKDYIKHRLYWFDELKLIDYTGPGGFHDIELWELKNHKNIFVFFTTSKDYAKYFMQKYHQVTGIGLTFLDIDFKIASDVKPQHHVHFTDRIVSDVIYDLTKTTYQLEFNNDKTHFVEIFINGLVKFGVEKNNHIVLEIIHHTLENHHYKALIND